jgi:peptidylprolyl isomerase
MVAAARALTARGLYSSPGAGSQVANSQETTLERNQIIAIGGAAVLAIAAGVALYVGVSSDEPEGSEEAASRGDSAPLQKFAKMDGVRADMIPAAPADIPTAEYRDKDGVQVHDMVVGTGKTPERGSLVTVEYAGWLLNGKPFDSSYRRAESFEFILEVGGVIQGWHIGVDGMKEGGKRQIIIPPEHGYGSRGKGQIPPDAVLVFQIELLEVGPTRLGPDKPSEVAANAFKSVGSGLKIADVVVGEGEAAAANRVVSFDMSAFSEDGTQLWGSSWQGKEPIATVAGAGMVLPAWESALIGMKPGGKRLIHSPPDMAYGEKGRRPIPPGANVLFEVVLHDVGELRIVPKKPSKAGELTKMDSGLQYADLVVGTGAAPKEGDVVWTEYAGWLADGTLFDSSFKRPEPFNFDLHTGRVIKGWHLGVDGMKVGGKRQLVIPPDLAYGERGGGPIPPNSTLTFEIELVGVGAMP